MGDYRTLADAVAEDIRGGRIGPGERLPPQREFAYRNGIAPSTASRVYAELLRRGLVSGEVGRGTFVRAAPAPASNALSEPTAAPIDLEYNFPILQDQAVVMAEQLRPLLRPASLEQALRPVGTAGTAKAREVAARHLARPGFEPQPEQFLFTGGGRQAIAAAFSTVAAPGERIGIEAITYAVVKGIAARLGVTLVPIAMDSEGLSPDALLEAHGVAPLKAVYLQPSVQNPLGCTMGADRRRRLGDALERLGLTAIEDGINSFLVDETPLAAFVPERVIFLDSLSKRVAPGLSLGFIISPLPLTERIAAAIRGGAWGTTGFELQAGVGWMKGGAGADLIAAKRNDAMARQRIAREALSGLEVRGDERAYHLWLELPDAWRAELFAAAAARRGIALTPASAFAVAPGHAPNAVRLALASPPDDRLKAALSILADLARSGPDAHGVD